MFRGMDWKDTGPAEREYVKCISYHPTRRVERLTIEAQDASAADALEPYIRELDALAERKGVQFILSGERDPMRIGAFLVDKKLISQECVDKIKSDLETYTKEMMRAASPIR